MSATLIKLSDSVLKAVGATNGDEFCAKLVDMLQANAKATETIGTLTANLKTANDSIAAFADFSTTAQKAIAAQALLITGLDAKLGNPSLLTEAKITELATTAGTAAGSKTAMEAVGAVGAGAPPAPAGHPAGPAKPGTEAKTFPDIVAANCAAGKSKTDAVMAAVKSNPVEHKAWLQAGGTL